MEMKEYITSALALLGGGLFAPGRPVMRAELAAVAVRVVELSK